MADYPFEAPRSFRGFLIRVATIAVAGLIVLGAMDMFEYLRDSHSAHQMNPYDRGQPKPPHQDLP